jgi:plastocyanin
MCAGQSHTMSHHMRSASGARELRREHKAMLLRSLALASAGLLLTALPASAATTTIGMGENYFQPGVRSVAKGTRVVWVNNGNRYHTVTTRSWSVTLKPGERYSRRVHRGFRYVCAYHGAMVGRITLR